MLNDVEFKFHANMPSRNTSRTSGAGTSPLLSTERNTHGLMAKSSSKAQTRFLCLRTDRRQDDADAGVND
jgi:hypothetical protein